MKILNLYAGIGGNRKLWGEEHEVTAIESNESIANAYKKFFPEDKIIIGDAHQYLLDHYTEFDFVWSSPPCPTHSRMRKTNTGIGERKSPPSYPDMALYQEIIFLTHFFKGKFVVENVISYYDALIKPQILNRHYFWSNFPISEKEVKNTLNIRNGHRRKIGFDLSGIKLTKRKDQVLNNCVEPELGLHIFQEAFKVEQKKVQKKVSQFK
ncbi:hypothetical protein LCGC14_0374170 [marine sediment metagenome]|uniref:DNA (cytosine-5-)-methyltransferase n=1 Tax=marine sediment metagenome TaxID=412755 RepID=A0A0F9TM77_9ZZZZ